MRKSSFRSHPFLVGAFLATTLAACGGQEHPGAAATEAAAAPATGPAEIDAPVASGAAEPAAFDREAVAVSEADMGAFPYLTLPEGYSSERRTNETMQMARFPFWVDGDSHWVEGKFQLTDFTVDDASTNKFSQFEARRHVENLVEQWGGVKVSEAQIPQAAIDTWGAEITQGFNGGLGDIYNNPAHIYFIRRNDGDVWIHFVANTAQAWTVVGKQVPDSN